MLKKIFQFFLFLGLGLGIMALVFRSQNTAFQEQCRLDGTPTDQCSLVDKLLHDFSTINLGWMLVVVVAFTVSNMFRAARWQMLLELWGIKPFFSNRLFTILLGYFANLGFPRMGEVVRAGALARYENIPLEKVIGTCVVDRLIDFLCLGLVVVLAFVFEGQTLLEFLNRNRGGQGGGLLQNPWVIGLLVLGILGLLLALIFRHKISDLAITRKIIALMQGFGEGLRSILKLKNPVLFLAYSLGIWLMFYLQCYFNLKAFPPTAHLDAGAALMVFVFGTLGFVIPSPGGMGSFHALAIAGLALYGIGEATHFRMQILRFLPFRSCITWSRACWR